MFRVMTMNLNGIRSAARKGFFTWMQTQNIDVLCVQELKATESDLQTISFSLEGYHAFYYPAEKKGYSGVGIFTRHSPDQVVKGLGFHTADTEGRYLAIQIGSLWVASLYMPSGTSSEQRQTIKYDFLDKYAHHLHTIQTKQQDYIICGDWNIAHKNIDLKNWKSNQKNSGFLPEERAWMEKLFTGMGYVDAFRCVDTSQDQYTWWSYRGQAWTKNVGWRIDYQVITDGLKPTVKSAMIYKNQRFSDHAPLVMEYAIIPLR